MAKPEHTTPLWMVFDCESVGLHGEAFAVGYVVVDAAGNEMGYGKHVCLSDKATGTDEGRIWVAANVPSMPLSAVNSRQVRDLFWADWLSWKSRGAVLVADCQWPVEARFLIACIDDAPDERGWSGPYPMHELASFMVAAGLDPMATYDRLPGELQHDPLGDARQSARLLVKALGILSAAPAMLEALRAWDVARKHSDECDCDGDCEEALRLWAVADGFVTTALAAAQAPEGAP